MDRDGIRARLNLFAVLRNIEDLARLDPETAALIKDWDTSVQFSVRQGPTASLLFRGGKCWHEPGPCDDPRIKLFFTSAARLNNMFEGKGKGTPIPLKGFTRLGFMQREFPKLTDRLEYFLKPENGSATDEECLRINTILLLHTVAHAVKELALHDPLCQKVAARIPRGTLQLAALPDGPYATLTFSADGIAVDTRACEAPEATMTFQDWQTLHAMLSGEISAFEAVGTGAVVLRGLMPIIDNTGLIMDRVEGYLA